MKNVLFILIILWVNFRKLSHEGSGHLFVLEYSMPGVSGRFPLAANM